jgi:repressor LexA
MIEDGIRDGDLLVVQRREDAEYGQTVVALVAGEATVKRYYRQGDKVELRPANERFSPIVAEPSSVQLQGVVVGLVRTFS